MRGNNNDYNNWWESYQFCHLGRLAVRDAFRENQLIKEIDYALDKRVYNNNDINDNDNSSRQKVASSSSKATSTSRRHNKFETFTPKFLELRNMMFGSEY